MKAEWCTSQCMACLMQYVGMNFAIWCNLADVLEALHYSKQAGKRPSCESFWYKWEESSETRQVLHVPFLPSRLQMSQRPKSQYMKSNFEFRKDPNHAKKFYQIVPQKRYDSYWAIHWICCGKQWIRFQAFVFLGWERASTTHIIERHCRGTKWEIEKIFWSGNVWSVWLCTNIADWLIKIDSSSKPLVTSIKFYSSTFGIAKKEISRVREWSEFSI